MLGFAIVDCQPSARATAVWLTSRVDVARVGHTNAVVVQYDDTRHDTKIRVLTIDRAVVLTPGSEPPLPFVHTLALEEFAALVEQTTAHQLRIMQAIDAYSARSRNRDLVRPDFPPAPQPPQADHVEPAPRALAVANYVARAWAAWLATDEQRRRRTVDPRSGASPWIMPEELGSRDLADFPPAFAACVQPEPVR